MKAIPIIIPLLVLISSNAIGQKKLTKDEIFKNEIKFIRYRQLPKDSVRFAWDEQINRKLHSTIKDLQNSNIDSLIIYSISYPGFSGKVDTCSSGSDPISTFIIWKYNGLTKMIHFNGKCQTEAVSIVQDSAFAFYNDNYQELKKEEFMPVILDAELINGKFRTSRLLVDHEPNYLLLFIIGNHHKTFQFSENDLKNKRSIFHTDNISLKAHAWWKIISRLVGE